MPIASKEVLQRVSESIARRFDPKVVIVFGSQARGDATEDSDIDLLVVQDTSTAMATCRREEIAKIRMGIPPIGIPIDILLFTPEEVDRWVNTTNHIISDAYREGKILYVRPGSREDTLKRGPIGS